MFLNGGETWIRLADSVKTINVFETKCCEKQQSTRRICAEQGHIPGGLARTITVNSEEEKLGYGLGM